MAAVATYAVEIGRERRGDLGGVVDNLLADLMHLCDHHGLNFAEALARGRRYYREECDNPGASADLASVDLPRPRRSLSGSYVGVIDDTIHQVIKAGIYDELLQAVALYLRDTQGYAERAPWCLQLQDFITARNKLLEMTDAVRKLLQELAGDPGPRCTIAELPIDEPPPYNTAGSRRDSIGNIHRLSQDAAASDIRYHGGRWYAGEW